MNGRLPNPDKPVDEGKGLIMNKKVSLIMPCYNAEPYIDVMLASVYSQLHDDIELICVNDGSTDQTLAKLEGWKPLMERRGYSMIIASKENGGTASAINVGLGLLTGDYVCFPDNDDMLMPGYVSEMLAFLESHPGVGWVKCDAFSYNTYGVGGPVIRSVYYPKILHDDRRYLVEQYLANRERWAIWTIMAKVDFFRKCVPNMKLEEDHEGYRPSQEFQINLPLAFNSPFAYLDRPLYFYFNRKDGSQLKQTQAGYAQAVSYFEGCYNIAKKVFSKFDAPKDAIKRWELICSISLNMRCIYYASIYKMQESRDKLICKQLELIGLNDESPLSDFALQFFTDCALDRIIYTSEELREHVSTPIKELYKTLQNSRIILYGAGEAGQMLLSLLVRDDIKPECMWDKNAENLKNHIPNIPVLLPNPDKLTTDDSQNIIVVISIQNPQYAKEAADLLATKGFENIVPFKDIYTMFCVMANS